MRLAPTLWELRFGDADNTEGTSPGTSAMSVAPSGVVTLTGLPTADPSVAGQLWNSSGTLKVSAG